MLLLLIGFLCLTSQETASCHNILSTGGSYGAYNTMVVEVFLELLHSLLTAGMQVDTFALMESDKVDTTEEMTCAVGSTEQTYQFCRMS